MERWGRAQKGFEMSAECKGLVLISVPIIRGYRRKVFIGILQQCFMLSIAQSQCLTCPGGRDMHYAGKKEFCLHLVYIWCIFSFSFHFFSLWHIECHLKKKKAALFLSEVFLYGSCTLQGSSLD